MHKTIISQLLFHGPPEGIQLEPPTPRLLRSVVLDTTDVLTSRYKAILPPKATMPEFIKVANASDLPAGRAATVQIGNRTIAIFNVNGEFFALDNVCTHRGGPLAEGFVDRNNLTVQCPWHGWIYSLTTGKSSIDSLAKVEKFEVKVEGDEVRISLD